MSEFNTEDLDEVIASTNGSLVQMLALQLKNELAKNTALTSQLESVVAENAALKAGFKYFSYSEISGFEEHGTAELAMKSADADLAGERDEASSEGWSEETDTICWGVIVQKAVENKFEKPSDENGWIGWSDYTLLPLIETPATSAFLAEVQASGADECVRQLVISDDDDFSDAPNVCAMVAHQLRQGGAE